jgi:hypothetical protein
MFLARCALVLASTIGAQPASEPWYAQACVA